VTVKSDSILKHILVKKRYTHLPGLFLAFKTNICNHAIYSNSSGLGGDSEHSPLGLVAGAALKKSEKSI